MFLGGVVAYANSVKQNLLDVDEAVVIEHGAVSEQVALAMAAGCREKLGTDYGLAVSGISGPSGGTEDKPVGTTWIGLATPLGAFAHCYRFPETPFRSGQIPQPEEPLGLLCQLLSPAVLRQVHRNQLCLVG